MRDVIFVSIRESELLNRRPWVRPRQLPRAGAIEILALVKRDDASEQTHASEFAIQGLLIAYGFPSIDTWIIAESVTS